MKYLNILSARTQSNFGERRTRRIELLTLLFVLLQGKGDPVEIANESKTYFDDVYVNSAGDAAAVNEFAMLRRGVIYSAVNHVAQA